MRTAAASLAGRYGYQRIDTPVMAGSEPTGRSGAILRAYVEGALNREAAPARLFYLEPIVSPEGDTWHFGAEAIGEASPEIDAEIIELGWRWFEAQRITGVSLQVKSPASLIAGLRASGLLFTHLPDEGIAFSYWHNGDGGERVLLGSGERHDQLAQSIGLRPTPAVGFALDMNRTSIVLARQHPQPPPVPDVYAIAIEASSRPYVHRLAAALRQRGYRVILDATESDDVELRVDKANRSGARVAIIAGPELERTTQVIVRDLQTHSEVTAWEARLADAVRRVFAHLHADDQA